MERSVAGDTDVSEKERVYAAQRMHESLVMRILCKWIMRERERDALEYTESLVRASERENECE